MKKVIGYFKNHLKEDFSFKYYFSLALFLAGCLVFNYYFDFEDSIIDSYHGESIRILFYFLHYSFAYFGAVVLIKLFHPKSDFMMQKAFWVKSIFGLFILAFDASFHYHEYLISDLPYNAWYVAQKILKNLVNIVAILLPMVLFYHLIDQDKSRFYGLSMKGFDYKPYLLLLLAMLPLIITASFLDNFNQFYPMYKANTAYTYFNVPEWLPAITYELAYGWNFLTVELVFRGFMVIGLAKIMGRHAVIPMVAVYCFYHFGKPEGEAISSIFGGYILGVIALYSRSIFGGVIIHVGIAWMMEFFAWLQQNKL